MARILPVLLLGYTCFLPGVSARELLFCTAGLRHIRCTSCRRLVRPPHSVCLSGSIRCKAGLPAWAGFAFPRLFTFPCVPTVAAACTAACKPGPAVTAAVPHRSFTCFPILPAGLAAPDTLQLLCAYQNITNIFIMQTKMPRNNLSFAAFLMFGFSGIRSRPPHRCGYAEYGTAMRADHTAPADVPPEARGSD